MVYPLATKNAWLRAIFDESTEPAESFFRPKATKRRRRSVMRFVKYLALSALYAFEALLLGLFERLARGLTKKLSAWQTAAEASVIRLNEKRAALTLKR